VPSSSADPQSFRYARAILLTTLVGMGFGMTVLFAILSPLGREVGFTEFEISTIIAASSLTVFLASPRWGRLSDRWGRKKVLLTGLCGYVVGTTLFASVFHATLIGVLVPAVGFYALMISRIGHASLMAAMMPSASAYMADITDVKGRTKGMSAVGAATNLGSILGPAAGGLLAGITLLTPLWVAAGLAAATAIFVVYFLPESPHKPIITARVENRLRYTDKRIVPFLIVGVLMFMGMAMVQQTLAFRFQDVLNLTAVETAQTFGLAMGLSATASLMSQLFLMQRFDLAPFAWLRLAMPLLIVAFACMAVADGKAMLMGAMVLQGAGMGIAGPAFMAGASLAVTEQEQGALAGIAGSCGPLGFTIGPLLGGFMYQIEPSLPYKFTLVVYIPLFFFVLWINRRLIRH
jgi:MFS family permease